VIGCIEAVAISKEEYHDQDRSIKDNYASFVHELGNILATRYFHDSLRFGDPNGIGQARDQDTGAKLQRCVFPSSINF